MSWVALVGPELEENLSLRYLASVLTQAGIRAEIIPFNSERAFASVLSAIVDAATPPLVVGVSLAFQWRAKDALALVVALRHRGYQGHITCGGHFATFACQELLRDFPEIDSICRQEAEITFLRLTEAVRDGTPLAHVAGLGIHNEDGQVVLTDHPPLPDLAKLPWPDRRGTPARCFAHGIAPIVGSRGCYANCSFCCIAAWHQQSLPGTRYRLRSVEDIADEMVAEKRNRGIEIFVFHDDNFFVPGHQRNAERFSALADALEARGIGRFATVVKARPTDADPQVFEILKTRLHCIRMYVGVESDSEQGLRTLRRWAHSKQNHEALALVEALGIYTCFNLLLFDPDTTLHSLRENVRFMQRASMLPFNFGRVELYAGTPLLSRMQQEGRAVGDYLQWDYPLASAAVERVFTMTMAAFRERNFGADALANRVMGLRFDIEVCRHFHPECFLPSFFQEGLRITRELSDDSVSALSTIIDHVGSNPDESGDRQVVDALIPRLRSTEMRLSADSQRLAKALQLAVGQGFPLSDVGDVATPLQSANR